MWYAIIKNNNIFFKDIHLTKKLTINIIPNQFQEKLGKLSNINPHGKLLHPRYRSTERLPERFKNI